MGAHFFPSFSLPVECARPRNSDFNNKQEREILLKRSQKHIFERYRDCSSRATHTPRMEGVGKLRKGPEGSSVMHLSP